MMAWLGSGARAGLLGLLTVLALGMSGCKAVNSALGGNSEKEAKAAIDWSFGPKEITLELESDPELNRHDQQAHTLMLAVLQMAEPNVFVAQLADSAAVARMLGGEPANPAFLSADRFVVEPGKARVLQLDRAQQAKYVGLVAGYYQLEGPKVARLIQIPVEVKSSGWVVKDRTAFPSPILIKLKLGPEQIVNAQRQVLEPGERVERAAAAADAGPAAADGSEISAKDIETAREQAAAAKKLKK